MHKMRRAPIYIVLLVAVASVLKSCNRDELCYLHPQGAQILVLADWQTKARVSPNAATLMVYNADNQRLISEVRMPNPYHHILDLPVGRYSIVIFNETLTGSIHDQTVGYRNWDRLETFELYNKEESFTGEETLPYKTNPDTVAVDRLLFYEVTQEMIDGFHLHPSPQGSAATWRTIADTVRFTPPRIISVVNVTLEVVGLQYAASYRATLHGMSGSYFLGVNRYSTHPISHPVRFTSLSPGAPRSNVDQLYASMSIMGLVGDIPPAQAGALSYLFDLSVTLINGEKRFFTWDLVEEERIALIREADHEHPHDLININLELALPPVLGLDNGFDTDLSDWFEHIVDMHTTTLQFNSNGGSGAIVPIRRSYNTKFPLPACTFTPPVVAGLGLAFKEWNTKRDGGGTSYQPNEVYTMPRVGGILYAIWQ